MAAFLGLRFLLLVLCGLAVCESDSSDTQTSPAPQTSPPVTPATSSSKSNAGMSNVTTKATQDCNYNITRVENGTYAFVVEIHGKNISYSVKYTDAFNHTTSENTTAADFYSGKTTIKIRYKALMPCRNYTVQVNPPCKALDKFFFTTDQLNKDDIYLKPPVNGTKVWYETKWNLSKSFDINETVSCTEQPFTFDGNTCQNNPNILLPPEKPSITIGNNLPFTFNWTNKPTYCKRQDLSENCSFDESLEMNVVSNIVSVKFKYNCSWLWPIVNKQEKTPGAIECEVKNTSEAHPDTTSLQIHWNLTSTKCPEFTSNITNAAVTCKNYSETVVGSCTRNTSFNCNVSGLLPYKEYICDLKSSYKNFNRTFDINFEKKVRTLPGVPNVTFEDPRLNDSNNIIVNINVKNWNGEEGNCTALLYLGVHLQSNTSNETCSFKFENLYYSSNYTLKVYARNGNNNRTPDYVKSITTNYNHKAVLGFLAFLIVLTSLALLFVLFKIYLLKKKESRNECEMDDLLPTSTLLPVDPIPAEALVETYKRKIADEGRLFMDEFQSIPRIFSNYTVKEAKKVDNQSRNRYIDILPYDYNRVQLSSGGSHDYINASFIEGYKETNKYIAAQGPKEETIDDFWRMIWEQQTSIIVMVTRCEEGNKNKCAQYWPSKERETEIYDDFVVKIKGEEECPDYVIRHLSLMNRKEKATERDVTHIQFTSWPDHGVPSDPSTLLKLRRRVNSFKNFFSGPIVTHCSAGVGRTGTYICIDAMIESLEAEGRADIYGYVVKLRRQRCLMVQVEAQYVLIHTALIEYNQFGETEISLSDLHSEINTLRQKEDNELSLLEMEFQKLPKFRNWRSSNTAVTEDNKKKNRCSSVIPYDFNRVLVKLEEDVSQGSDAEDEDEYSSDEEDETPTKYINASYLDGYWCSKSLITAQGPLPDTVADFLQMLYQHRVKTVVMLTDCTENDQEFCSQYWSDEKKEFGEMAVEVKETETFPTYIRRKLELQHTKRKVSHTTEQYHFLKWAGNELPANPSDLIDMMRSIRQNAEHKNNRENRSVPIVVHCNDGSSRSGLFCALWNLLDSAETEKLVDVFQVTKNLRRERLDMIKSLEQYQFIYAALEVTFPMQNGEVKNTETPPDTVQIINEETALISATNEEQEGAAKSQAAEQPDTEASEASGANETVGTSEASEQPEKAPSENTTNGPTVEVA